MLRKYKLVNLLRKTVDISHKEFNKTVDKPQPRFTYQRTGNKKNMDIVKMFLSRDDNSRASAGKNETILRFKKKKQKRFLSDTMLHLHQKLMLEMPHLKLSYWLFCRTKPFWIVAPNINNRETCVCKLHDNAQMKADRLKHLGIINSQSLSKVAEELCCDTQAKACMYRECLSCKNKSLTHTHHKYWYIRNRSHMVVPVAHEKR